jgi:hypothetical protein
MRPDMKSRIVLPDGTGRDFDRDLGLKVGDVLDRDKHDGFNGWRVYDVSVFQNKIYYCVS